MNDRSIHFDLLDQVATSEEEARVVRRILGPDLQRELRYLHDFDRGPMPQAWPSCCGACDQGRKPCATQQACQISVDDDAERGIYTWRWIGAGLLLTWAVLAFAGIAAFY